MKQVCLYFGSFNPIHVGHLSLAKYILEVTKVNELWFVLSPSSPHKQGRIQLPTDRRAYYIQQAIATEPSMRLCRIEDSLPHPSYTIRTLRALELLYPNTSLSILMGADNLLSLGTWYECNRLLRDYQLLVYPRPGYTLEQTNTALLSIKRDHDWVKGIELLDAPLLDISSTQIRMAILRGEDMRHLLPQPALWEELSKELLSLSQG